MKITTQRLIGCAAFALALLSMFNLTLSTAHAQGALTPPGPPAPTMKSLDQIEARTSISSAPFTITNAGSYYLTTNVSVTGGAFTNAIVIAANNVTLDLNGFTILSTASSASGAGILLTSGRTNVTILNGFIVGNVTESGGVFGGGGFDSGINVVIDYNNTNSYGLPFNVRVARVSVSGVMLDGIYLNSGSSSVVESCTVRTVGSYGIAADIVKNSSAMDCGNNAVMCNQASDCHGQSSSGNGILAVGSAQNCYGYSSADDGVYAVTALNCYGYSDSDTYSGLNDRIAENCYGDDGGNGQGISATSALNCYGISRGSGIGLDTTTALDCYGYSYTGTGLSAYVGNACYGGANPSGTGEFIVYKYNMP